MPGRGAGVPSAVVGSANSPKAELQQAVRVAEKQQRGGGLWCCCRSPLLPGAGVRVRLLMTCRRKSAVKRLQVFPFRSVCPSLLLFCCRSPAALVVVLLLRGGGCRVGGIVSGAGRDLLRGVWLRLWLWCRCRPALGLAAAGAAGVRGCAGVVSSGAAWGAACCAAAPGAGVRAAAALIPAALPVLPVSRPRCCYPSKYTKITK